MRRQVGSVGAAGRRLGGGGAELRPAAAFFSRGKDALLSGVGWPANFSDGLLNIGGGDALASGIEGEQAGVVDGIDNGLHVA